MANFGVPSPKNEIVMDLSHELLVNTPAPYEEKVKWSGRTDRRMDKPTDICIYRALMELKMMKIGEKSKHGGVGGGVQL